MPSFTKISLTPSNMDFSQIMRNGQKYFVPRFQRDYTWDAENWAALWDDVQLAADNRQQRFMGYLVLQEIQESVSADFRIIDGQQRLTTLTIAIVAILARLGELADAAESAEDVAMAEKARTLQTDIRQQYVGMLNHRTLRTDQKLTLNRNSKRYFRSLADHLEARTEKSMRSANRSIKKCFDFFHKKISAHDSDSLVDLIEIIGRGLLFTVVTANDSQQAYTLFETLNARGVHLSSSDLIKNYLMGVLSQDSRVSDDDFDDIDEKWASASDELGDLKFTDFLRSHYAMTRELPAKAALYGKIKSAIDTSEKTFAYMRDVEKFSTLFACLQAPSNEFWHNNGYPDDVRESMEALRLFHIRSPLSVLMAAHEKFDKREFARLLQCIVNFSVRYNVIAQKMPGAQEDVYNKMANKIMQGEAALPDAIAMIRPLYPDDAEFESAFGQISMPSRRSVKRINYLLHRVEKSAGGELPAADATIEHVLPYSPEDHWLEYFGQDAAMLAAERLGNFAILPPEENMGQEPWAQKREVLKNSRYRINQEMAKYPEWDRNSVAAHQMWLAKQAAALWRIAEF